MKFKNESEFRKKVMSDLKKLDYLTYAIPDSRHQLGDKGYPDVTAAGRGFIAFIECKMPGKYLFSEQADWKDAINLAVKEIDDYCAIDAVAHFTIWPSSWREVKREHFMSVSDRGSLCVECLELLLNTTCGQVCANAQCELSEFYE